MSVFTASVGNMKMLAILKRGIIAAGLPISYRYAKVLLFKMRLKTVPGRFKDVATTSLWLEPKVWKNPCNSSIAMRDFTITRSVETNHHAKLIIAGVRTHRHPRLRNNAYAPNRNIVSAISSLTARERTIKIKKGPNLSL